MGTDKIYCLWLKLAHCKPSRRSWYCGVYLLVGSVNTERDSFWNKAGFEEVRVEMAVGKSITLTSYSAVNLSDMSETLSSACD